MRVGRFVPCMAEKIIGVKSFCAILIIGLLLLGSGRCFSQSFINLNFESATIIPATDSPYYPYGIATSTALPGWTVLIGGAQQSEITYNSPSTGATWVSLWATNGEQIDGNFSVLLQGGGSASVASISQAGLVPVGAQMLFFEAQPGLGTLEVTLGGQDIPFSAISTGPNYTLYGGDISAFAGQVEDLEFSALEGAFTGGGLNGWNIDDIQFSTDPAPEPGTFALCALGGLCLAWQRRKKLLA